jgi:hypothetical protein
MTTCQQGPSFGYQGWELVVRAQVSLYFDLEDSIHTEQKVSTLPFTLNHIDEMSNLLILSSKIRSSLSSTSPALPRKPSAYVTPSVTASSTLPRMHHTRHSSVTSQPIVRVTAKTYSTDTSLAAQPRMSASPYQSNHHPVRGDVISGPPMSSNQRFAQAISGSSGDGYSSGYSSTSYGRTSPLITTSTTHLSSTPHSSLSSSYSTGFYYPIN